LIHGWRPWQVSRQCIDYPAMWKINSLYQGFFGVYRRLSLNHQSLNNPEQIMSKKLEGMRLPRKIRHFFAE
jgi:hypothetical protein